MFHVVQADGDLVEPVDFFRIASEEGLKIDRELDIIVNLILRRHLARRLVVDDLVAVARFVNAVDDAGDDVPAIGFIADLDGEPALEVDDGEVGRLVVCVIILDDRDTLGKCRTLFHLVLIHLAVPTLGEIIKGLFERGGEQGRRMDVLQYRMDERTEHGLLGLGLFDPVYLPEFVFQGAVLIGVECGV